MKRKLSAVLALTVCVLMILSASAFAAGGIIIGNNVTQSEDYSMPPASIPETGPVSPSTSYGGNIIISAGNGSHSSTGYSGGGSTGSIIVNNETTVNPVSASPKITKNPSGETVDNGGNAVFVATANDATSITWYLRDASGAYRIPASSIGQYIKGASSSGANTERLVLYGLTENMNGWSVEAEFSNQYGTTTTSSAWIDVLPPTPTPTPVPTPTPTPAPTPTPTPAPTPTPYVNPTGGNGGTTGRTGTGTVNSNGSGGMSNTNGTGVMNNQPGTVNPNAAPPEEPSSGGYTSITGTEGSGIDDAKITNTVNTSTATSANTGAYILAAAAGAVIIGAIAVMALYMKGKISLGKFENIIGAEDAESADGSEFYNPDDFKSGGNQST